MNQQRNKPKDANQTSKLLSAAENTAVFDTLGPRKITKATAVVQLFFANQSPSQWAKQNTGILCFVKVGWIEFGIYSVSIPIISSNFNSASSNLGVSVLEYSLG